MYHVLGRGTKHRAPGGRHDLSDDGELRGAARRSQPGPREVQTGAQARTAVQLERVGAESRNDPTGQEPPALEIEAIAVMTTLNWEASRAMLEAGATAATDVTGYGLIGHLANLRGGAEIDFESVPFMKGVGNLAERDLFPDGSRRNHAAFRDQVQWGGLGETEQLMLCDAQTSGGLLVAIPPENAARFTHGDRIGVMRDDGVIRVRP